MKKNKGFTPPLKCRSCRSKSSPSRAGFTLVELLLALALSTLLMGAIGAMLLGISQTARVLDFRKGARLENSLIALEKMKREIQTSPVVPVMALEGKENKISFPEWVSSGPEAPLTKAFRLGQVQNVSLMSSALVLKKVEYYFDSSKMAVMRREDSEEAKVFLGNIEVFDLQYAISPLGGTQWKWERVTPKAGDASRIGAMHVFIKWDTRDGSYTIPGIDKTFFVVRQHPMNAILDKQPVNKELPA